MVTCFYKNGANLYAETLTEGIESISYYSYQSYWNLPAFALYKSCAARKILF